jgi:hypothetical protein
MQNKSLDELAWAVVQTVAYSDVFDYPLTAREIHHFLAGAEATSEEVDRILEQGVVTRIGNYFTLSGREKIVDIRVQREQRSRELLPTAIRYGRILGSLPYIRMVALTGSLAVLNVSKDEDFDYMLVTAPGRVWTARAFAVSFNRLVRMFGHTICPNLILSENALEWPLHDLYSARELYQMIPITGMDMYQRLLKANAWANDFLPNAFLESGGLPPKLQEQAPALQSFLESCLHGEPGDKFEAWEMNRKIARFSKQAGFGEETIFTAEVCQGNFHHHRKWTREVFEEKLRVIASGAERNEASPARVSEIASSPVGSSQRQRSV